jgi:uncharacterized cupredoxin-like copper-binding protein
VKARAAIVATAAALLAAGCGGGSDESSSETTGAAGGSTNAVQVTLDEWSVAPQTISVDTTGEVTFRVTNAGDQQHALEVQGDGVEEETDTLDPGADGTLTVTLERGTNEVYCPLFDHRSRGMEASLAVAGGGGGAPGGGTTTDEDTGGYGYG